MRRTITIQNLFTTCIRSWQGKAASIFCVFLILLLSCKDEDSYIGFPRNSRFSTQYVEIPLKPSVLQIRGLITTNDISSTSPRIMIGKFNDPHFGNMDVRGYTNYAPPQNLITASPDATVDSLVLQLVFDLSHYGSISPGDQHLQVFTVLDTLQSNYSYISGVDTLGTTGNYYNNSVVNIDPTPIGDITYNVDPDNLDNLFLNLQDTDTTNDPVFKIRIKLSGTLATDLLNEMVNNSSIFSDFRAFSGKYKGLAFILKSGDQILRINPNIASTYPSSKESKLSLYFTDTGLQVQADFPLKYVINLTSGQDNPVTSFSTVTSDYSGTSLSGIQPLTDFVPFDNYFVQSGSAFMTKFDLTDFYKYIDTLNSFILSSAQIALSNSSTQPPTNIQFRVLDENNQYLNPFIDTLLNGVIVKVPNYYYQKMASNPTVVTLGTPTTSPTVDLVTDLGTLIPIDHTVNQLPDIFITELCQKLYRNKTDPRRIKYFGLMVETSEFQSSVNSLILDKGVSLKIYYSKPAVNLK